jgi:hypothetical protein
MGSPRTATRRLAWEAELRLPVSLIPRWQFMTDEAKALTRRAAASAAVALVALLLFRALLPWVLLGLIAWWAWKAISR